MSLIQQYVREQIGRAEHQREQRRAKNWHDAERLRFAWALGVETLYKCKSLDGSSRDFTLDIIENSRMYFPTPPELNDPLDCRPVFELDGDAGDVAFVRRLLDDELAAARAAGQTTEQLEILRAKEGVPVEQLAAGVTQSVCRTLTENTRVFSAAAGRSDPLLWRRYASEHRGICLHFRAKGGSVFGLARQVNYLVELDPILIPLENQQGDAVADRMVLNKTMEWSYEQEFRIVWDNGIGFDFPMDAQHRVSFPPELLCGISLGMRISDADRDIIQKVAAHHDSKVPVWQARERKEGSAMGFDRIA
jgi:hypothetical protein